MCHSELNINDTAHLQGPPRKLRKSSTASRQEDESVEDRTQRAAKKTSQPKVEHTESFKRQKHIISEQKICIIFKQKHIISEQTHIISEQKDNYHFQTETHHFRTEAYIISEQKNKYHFKTETCHFRTETYHFQTET